MELIIQVLSGEKKSVLVNPNMTVGELKKQIAPSFNARPSRLRLSITNGQILQLDQDQKTVRDYGLSTGSTVMLLISSTPKPMQVFVKNVKGQTKTYNITDEETVDQLMSKVFRVEKIPVDQQRLVYNEQQLESGKDLHYYNIVPGSKIYMVLHLRGG